MKEKTEQNAGLKAQNEALRMLTNADSEKQLSDLRKERDRYKQQVAEMEKFLSDYGLKWVGGEGGQRHQGEFD